MEKSDSEETSTSETYAFDYEAKIGFEFNNESISESFSETIARDSQNSKSYDRSVDYTITCTPPDGSQNVGLW